MPANNVGSKKITYDQRTSVENILRRTLERQRDGRWKYMRYDDGSVRSDRTVAKEVGCSVNAVDRIRNERYPGGFVTQFHEPRRIRRLALEPEQRPDWDAAEAHMVLRKNVDERFEEHAAKINVLFELLDGFTAPPRATT